MSKYVTPDGKSIEFKGKRAEIPEGWLVVPHTDMDYIIQDSDMTFQLSDGFIITKSAGQEVRDKICVLRKAAKVEKQKPKAKEKPVKRLNQEDFLKSINGL